MKSAILPENEKIILVYGFIAASKGWNIIKKCIYLMVGN